MPVSSPCPAVGDLQRIRLGQCTQEELAAVSAHLQQCPTCAARVQALTSLPGGVTPTLMSALLTANVSAVPPLPQTPSWPAAPAALAVSPAQVGRHAEPLPERIGRYPIVGLIGRGGMGIVYRGLDVSLQRALAIKVLLPEHARDAELQQRFVKEAQIMGQLQHPGVAPIHEIGTLADGRPFFSMKQIHGQTLAALLKSRRSPADDLATYISIFAAICQTLAAAHVQRIIHRDLKPGNVMVGAFGEVQVMDWGLAKQLIGTPAEPRPVAAVPDDDRGTLPGTVLGTPAYMPPEQARGEIERMEEPSDVFGLGAILCEILTAAPPYRAATLLEVMGQAATANLDDARQRLRDCGADADLVDLCRRCLDPEPGRRPRHAGETAAEVARYQAQVQQRLQAAQLARAAAQGKAGEERRRRRTTVALLALTLAFVVAVSGAAVWYFENQAERTKSAAQSAEQIRAAEMAQARLEAKASQLQAAQQLGQAEKDLRDKYVNQGVQTALDEAGPPLADIAEHLADPVKTALLLSDPERQWKARLEQAERTWQRAQTLADSNREALAPALSNRLGQVKQQQLAARRQWSLATELDAIRLSVESKGQGKLDPWKVGPKYQACFARLGLDFASGDAKALAAEVAASPLRFVLVAALDDWALLTPRASPLLPCLLETARLADPNPWRDQVRNLAVWGDTVRLQLLAREELLGRHSPQIIILLAARLGPGQGADLLRRALLHHPSDFWLAFHLGTLVRDPVEQAGCYRAALAVRPKSALVWFNLGVALQDKGDSEGAAVAYHKAIDCDPRDAGAHFNLGLLAANRGQPDLAIVFYRKAIDCDATYAGAHYSLGNALAKRGEVDKAVPALRKAIELDPTYAKAYHDLGVLLAAREEWKEALVVFRKGIDLAPNNADTHACLGIVLSELQRFGEAIPALRKAIACNPKHAVAHAELGKALRSQGSLKEAVEWLQQAAKQFPKQQDILQELQLSEQWWQLDQRLPELLAGTAQPSGASEAIQFADLCRQPFKKHYSLAVKLYQQAFAADDRLRLPKCFAAAYAAVQLAAGNDPQTKGVPHEAAAWRREALDWLQASLKVYRQAANPGFEDLRKQVGAKVGGWKTAADLAPVREPALLETLPAAERQQWQPFWAEVDQLLDHLSKPPKG
jgi:tetratricopeptide (TPR) repeat protein